MTRMRLVQTASRTECTGHSKGAGPQHRSKKHCLKSAHAAHACCSQCHAVQERHCQHPQWNSETLDLCSAPVGHARQPLHCKRCAQQHIRHSLCQAAAEVRAQRCGTFQTRLCEERGTLTTALSEGAPTPEVPAATSITCETIWLFSSV